MNQFEAAQKKIDLEQNARLVLLHMVQHQERNPSGSFSDGLIWTTKMISEHLRMSEPAATEVIQYLLRERLVERRGDEWYCSEIAAEIIRAEIKSTALHVGGVVLEFCDEALTGMDKYGGRSHLKNAALPASSKRSHIENREEIAATSRCILNERLGKVAARHSVSVDTVREWLVSGEMHHCGCCGDDFARFHRRPVSNWGEWQSHCIECRKKLRKEVRRENHCN